MTDGQLLHPLMHTRPDAGMWRMLVLSVAAHVLVALLFSGWLAPQAKREDRPVYYVDLISKPVANPQAGRPDGGGGENQGAAKEQPVAGPELPAKPPLREEAVIPPPPAKKADAVVLPVKTEAKPEVKPEVKAKPAAKPEAKAKTDPPAPPKPEVKASAEAKTAAAAKNAEKDYQQVMGAVAALQKRKESERRKEEIAALQERIAEMGRQRGGGGGAGTGVGSGGGGRGSGVAAPLGMPDGKGTEAGISSALWLQTYFRSNWRLSKYQISRPDLETEIRITYDADGNLLRKEIVKSSGDKVFDQSVEDAVLKSRKLPNPLPGPFEGTVIFNLRDLQQ